MPRHYFPEIIRKINKSRSQKMVDRILPFLADAKTILDIGCGPGYITTLLREDGKNVEAVDVIDKSFENGVNVKVYNGKKLPYRDKEFDVSLLITVLHHTPKPEKVFQEAVRVSKKIIVVETSYQSLIGKIVIFVIDALANLSPSTYFHSFKSNDEWRKFFNKYDYKIANTEHYWDKQLGVSYLHLLYDLEEL